MESENIVPSAEGVGTWTTLYPTGGDDRLEAPVPTMLEAWRRICDRCP